MTVYEGPRVNARGPAPPPADVTVSAAIQSHPARADLAASLAARLGGAEIVVDPDPRSGSPWRTYREALERTPAGVTHRLILQDDAMPCRGFGEAAVAALAAQPDRPVVFFVAGQPFEYVRAVYRASALGDQWAFLEPRYWLPCVAVAWPARFVPEILAFVDAQTWPPSFRSDDEILGRFLRSTREAAVATVPSLVQHPDVVPSLIGRRSSGGSNPARVACCFISDDCDAAGIDWTLGPTR